MITFRVNHLPSTFPSSHWVLNPTGSEAMNLFRSLLLKTDISVFIFANEFGQLFPLHLCHGTETISSSSFDPSQSLLVFLSGDAVIAQEIANCLGHMLMEFTEDEIVKSLVNILEKHPSCKGILYLCEQTHGETAYGALVDVSPKVSNFGVQS